MADDQVTTGAPKDILIVEDDKFLRELLVEKMTSEGFHIEVAVEGGQALEAIKKKKPHIILLDLVMPGMDGFKFLEHIKDNPDTASIPVIVLSNLGQKSDIDKAMRMGADAFLIKANFTMNDVASEVKKIIKEKYM